MKTDIRPWPSHSLDAPEPLACFGCYIFLFAEEWVEPAFFDPQAGA
jgi:hypothetical protein